MVEVEDMTTGQILAMGLIVLICMIALFISASSMLEYVECSILSEDGYDVEVVENRCKIIYDGIYFESSDYTQVALLIKRDALKNNEE